MKSRLLSAFLLSLAAVARLSADATVEERLQALERQVQQLSKENADLKRELGWKDAKAPVLVQPAGKEMRLSLGGFLQAQAEFGGAPDPRWAGIKDRFYFRRARIYAQGTFAENFDFKAELDLGGNSLNAGTGLMARANEIYIQWRQYPAAVVRFGQIKPAFGAEALLGDTRSSTIERSLTNDRLTDPRQLGFSVGGDIPGTMFGYLAVIGNGSGANASANDNSKFQKSARVFLTPVSTKDDRLILGVDGLWTADSGVTRPGFGLPGNLFSGNRNSWGVDAQWIHGPLDASVEYLHNAFKPAGAAAFDADGWQATMAYFVVPGKLQGTIRHEEFDPNTSLDADRIRSWTIGVNYLIRGEDLRLMLDYVHGDTPGVTTFGGRWLTRMQVLF